MVNRAGGDLLRVEGRNGGPNETQEELVMRNLNEKRFFGDKGTGWSALDYWYGKLEFWTDCLATDAELHHVNDREAIANCRNAIDDILFD
jgi:3-methyladenine DNA glycosylase AlkD